MGILMDILIVCMGIFGEKINGYIWMRIAIYYSWEY